MAFDDLPYQPPLQSAEARRYAATILELSRAVAAAGRCHLDLPYGPDRAQAVDVYLPAEDGATGLPVLLFLHGGGWASGYKEWMGFMAPPITSLPAIFVSVSYRLAPQHRYPAPLDDTFAAIEWAHRNIARYGGDPDRLFIGGHSAGGHLGALATLRTDLAARRGLPPGVIKGCFPVSAPFEFRFDPAEPAHKLFRDEADAVEASPINHVAGNRTPFHIVWGSRDLEAVVRTGPPMIEALRRQPGLVTSDIFDGLDHFDINVEQRHPTNRWVQTVRSWLTAPPQASEERAGHGV